MRKWLEEAQDKIAGRWTKPDMRCDVGGASGHVTIKPSSYHWPTFYKFGVYAMKAGCLALGGLLQGALGICVQMKTAKR